MWEIDWEFVWRLVFAALFGAVIGLDREYREKDAGFRTHFLVALGSALIMIISQYGFSDVINGVSIRLDPSRIAAQVVSGIGFLGAGMIIFNQHMVRGLTTAASLWAVAGIGLAAGAGMYSLALIATVLSLVALEGMTLLVPSLDPRRVLVVISATDREAIANAMGRVREKGIPIISYEVSSQMSAVVIYRASMVCKIGTHATTVNELMSILREDKDVFIDRVE